MTVSENVDLSVERQALREAADALYDARVLAGANGVVIYLATQHPLVADAPDELRTRPGLELRARAMRVAQLAKSFAQAGCPVMIVVSGNTHRDEHGVADGISLREAAIDELVDQGVDRSWIVKEDVIAKYRPDGVYCTEDEVAVAAGLYRDDERYYILIGVCGPAQSLRVLIAAENERVPMQLEVPVVFDYEGRVANPRQLFHKPTKEAVTNIPYTVSAPFDQEEAAAFRAGLVAERSI